MLAFALKRNGLNRTAGNPDAKLDVYGFRNDLVGGAGLVGHDWLRAIEFDLVAKASSRRGCHLVAVELGAFLANRKSVVRKAVLLGVLDEEVEPNLGSGPVVIEEPAEEAGRFLGHEVATADRSVGVDQHIGYVCIGLYFKPESAIDGADGAVVVGHLREAGCGTEKYGKCPRAAARKEGAGTQTDLDCVHRWRSQRAPGELLLHHLSASGATVDAGKYLKRTASSAGSLRGAKKSPRCRFLCGYWGRCQGWEQGFSKEGEPERPLQRRKRRGMTPGVVFSSGIEMSDNSPITKTLELSEEDIRLLLASIDETIDALNDWEFPARTGFDRSDFETLRRILHQHVRPY